MSISRWDPFRQVTTLSDAVNQLMQEAVLRPGFQLGSDAAVNVLQRPDQFLIQVALPGVKPEAIDITSEQSTLTIKAHRLAPFSDQMPSSSNGTEQAGFLVAEFGAGDFTRTITLPKAFRSEQLTASFDLGVLTIVVPIAPEAQPKKISVTSSSAQQMVGAHSSN